MGTRRSIWRSTAPSPTDRTKQEAVRLAVQAELDRAAEAIPLRERFAALRRAHPLPPPIGQIADKTFFDELSSEL